MSSSTSIITHPFEKNSETLRRFISTGKVTILWGLIKWPVGYWYTETIIGKQCRVCGEKEFTQVHGYLFEWRGKA